MPCENSEGIKSSYDEAMRCLSSLITRRTRADNNNTGDGFYLLFDYLKILELEEPIRHLKVIHVAGTKGKGSTCAFTESILRNCGLRTGLFTSPHLIDVRERFQLDGMDICKEKFLAYFWWCWDRLKEKTSDEIPMPSYFRFLTLLAFKIFAAEQVDVAILEVGLGGKFDATNVVKSPVVCGIASLGYDHMEILGNTLAQIAGEKAGIFKHGVPAFTVPQPDEAMHVLVEKASKLDVHLKIAVPLDPSLLNGLHLGLEGEHQYVNAGLAFALCSTWLQRTGHAKINYLEENALPDQFIKGLTTAGLRGRGQVVSDEVIETERQEDLVFYLDGAHSPESMDVCANWFCRILKEDYKHISPNNHEHNQSRTLYESVRKNHNYPSQKKSEQILLFNCMSVRDPNLLLPHLMSTCARHGVYFQKALFVPSVSVYNKVGKSVDPPKDAHVDISWQLTLQRVWENLRSGKPGIYLKLLQYSFKYGMSGRNSDKNAGKHAKDLGAKCEGTVINSEKGIKNFKNSSVFPSLPLALNFLRDTVRGNQSTRFQVLVTGSLHLVGDVLRLVKK